MIGRTKVYQFFFTARKNKLSKHEWHATWGGISSVDSPSVIDTMMLQIFWLEVMCQLECMKKLIPLHIIQYRHNIGIYKSMDKYSQNISELGNMMAIWNMSGSTIWPFLAFGNLCATDINFPLFISHGYSHHINPSWKMIHLYLTLSPPFVVCLQPPPSPSWKFIHSPPESVTPTSTTNVDLSLVVMRSNCWHQRRKRSRDKA